jgi:hypothetical protein
VFLKDGNPLFSFVVRNNGTIDSIHVSLSNSFSFNDAWWNHASDFGNRHHLMDGYTYRGVRQTSMPLGGIDFWAKY